jgi:DHA1 family tetracycline resistance protein-like MFS transporter
MSATSACSSTLCCDTTPLLRPEAPLITDGAINVEKPLLIEADLVSDAAHADNDATAEVPSPPQQCWPKFRFAVTVGVFAIILSSPCVLMAPTMIEVKRNYFGGDRRAAMVQGIVDCGIALINLIAAPAVGRVLDRFGRRPGFLLQPTILAFAALAACLTPTNPVPYMALSAVAAFVQNSYVITAISDVTMPEHRTHMFAVVQAMAMVGTLIGGGFSAAKFSDAANFGFAACCCAAAAVYAFFFIPETLPADRRTAMTLDGLNPIHGFGILLRSRALRISVVLMALVGTAMTGFGDVWMFYLNDKLQFTRDDLTHLMMLGGLTAPIALLVVLPQAIKRFQPVAILVAALLMTVLLILGVALAWSKLLVFALVPLSAAPQVVFLILTSVVANGGTPDLLARRLAAFTAINDLCGAIGPLVFGVAIGTLPKSMMSIPMVVAAALVFVGVPLVYPLQRAVELDATMVEAEAFIAEGIAVEVDAVAQDCRSE